MEKTKNTITYDEFCNYELCYMTRFAMEYELESVHYWSELDELLHTCKPAYIIGLVYDNIHNHKICWGDPWYFGADGIETIDIPQEYYYELFNGLDLMDEFISWAEKEERRLKK